MMRAPSTSAGAAARLCAMPQIVAQKALATMKSECTANLPIMEKLLQPRGTGK
jgi:hypothetical protein